MASKGTRVTAAEQEKMVRLYEKHRNYKKVGKIMRRSPDTVSKYVNQWAIAHRCVELIGGVELPPIHYIPVTKEYTPFF